MKNKTFIVGLLAFCAVMGSSCASVWTKGSKEITFKGVPGTRISEEKGNKFITIIDSNGFSTVKVGKKLKSKPIVATKDGYVPKYYTMKTKIQGAFWCNLLFGGIPGMAIDAATGKMMTWKDKTIDMTLQPEDTNDDEEPTMIVAQEVLPAPQQAVSRNNPGATDMENTVIRWYIDSDPRGARLFYRVISSVPAEVKNTNETYMMTTPYEETRSFNIEGLTYENSRNVTIELKVSKRGYEDQIKRFNVRQALDQQEISSFFELVEKSK